MKIYIAYINSNNESFVECGDTNHKNAFDYAKQLVTSGKAIASYYNEDINVAKAEARRRFNAKTNNKFAAFTEPTPAPTVNNTASETLPVHMVVKTDKYDENGNLISKATIQYKNPEKAIAAYKAAKSDPNNKVWAGYRTVTIRFNDPNKSYTYLTDRKIDTHIIRVNTDNGPETAWVISNDIMTRKQLADMAAKYGKTINDFFKVL